VPLENRSMEAAAAAARPQSNSPIRPQGCASVSVV
jgi:hypothetical protein